MFTKIIILVNCQQIYQNCQHFSIFQVYLSANNFKNLKNSVILEKFDFEFILFVKRHKYLCTINKDGNFTLICIFIKIGLKHALSFNNIRFVLQDKMELVTQDEEKFSWQRDSLVCSKVKNALLTTTTDFTILAQSQGQIVSQVVLKYKKKYQTRLSSRWFFRISYSLQIFVEMIDPHSQFSPPDQSIPIEKELLQLNKNQQQGVFFTNHKCPHLLTFKIIIPYSADLKYLSFKITELYINLSQKFIKFALTLKLLGAGKEEPSNRIMRLKLRLLALREYFEFNRKRMQNKKASNYNLVNCSIKSVNEARKIIGYNFGLVKSYKNQHQINFQASKAVFSKSEQSVKELLKERMTQQTLQIARGIDIYQQEDQKFIAEGGYSKVFRGKYQMNIIPSIYQSNNNIQNLNSIPEQISTKQMMPKPDYFDLVRKEDKLAQNILQKDNNQMNSSFKNQFQFLKFTRNLKNLYIANFFFRILRGKIIQNSQIFLQYYDRNFAEVAEAWKSNDLKLLKLIRQLFEAILFLSEKGILHRDLKQLNILMDSFDNPKIIDFGSCSGLFTNTGGQFQAFDNQLMSTKGYYMPYSLVQYKSIQDNYTRDEFNRSATFDIYSIGQIIINIFRLDLPRNNTIYLQLAYLVSKCKEINPADRLQPFQALTYIHDIIVLVNRQNNLNLAESRPNQSP